MLQLKRSDLILISIHLYTCVYWTLFRGFLNNLLYLKITLIVVCIVALAYPRTLTILRFCLQHYCLFCMCIKVVMVFYTRFVWWGSCRLYSDERCGCTYTCCTSRQREDTHWFCGTNEQVCALFTLANKGVSPITNIRWNTGPVGTCIHRWLDFYNWMNELLLCLIKSAP